MAEEVENAIRQNAQGPESAEVDGVKVKQHSLSGQIAADKYLAGRDARRNPARAFDGQSDTELSPVVPPHSRVG